MPSAFVPGALEPRQARLHSSLSMHPGHPCLSSRSRPVDFEAGLRDPSSKNPCANSSRSERALLGVGSDIAAGSLRGRGPSHPEPSWFVQPGLAGGSSDCNLNGRQINCKDAGLAESRSVVRIGQASRSWDDVRMHGQTAFLVHHAARLCFPVAFRLRHTILVSQSHGLGAVPVKLSGCSPARTFGPARTFALAALPCATSPSLTKRPRCFARTCRLPAGAATGGLGN